MAEGSFQHLSCRTDHDVLVLTVTRPRVRGDELADQLRTEMLAAVEQAGATRVVLDLQKVMEMTSRGFGAIAAFRHEFVKVRGGQVALCGLSPFVRETLELIRFIDS